MAKTSLKIKAKRKPKFEVRRKNRCALCGRPRGYLRFFNICRICLRKYASAGKIPGLRKASW
jgi:small subunit ribosomal protein S14